MLKFYVYLFKIEEYIFIEFEIVKKFFKKNKDC